MVFSFISSFYKQINTLDPGELSIGNLERSNQLIINHCSSLAAIRLIELTPVGQIQSENGIINNLRNRYGEFWLILILRKQVNNH